MQREHTSALLTNRHDDFVYVELSDRLVERYAGVADRLVMYFAFADWRKNPEAGLGRWSEVARDVIARTADTAGVASPSTVEG